MEIVHVRYIVDDVARAASFYRTHLGFEIAMGPAQGFAMLARGALRLLLNEPGAGGAGRSTPDGRAPEPGGWNRIQLRTDDLDALAAGGEYLRDKGYFRSWGIGRHIQGSQLFDYWRDPDGFLVEHFADGDMFDNTLEPGWAPFTASALAQWGPPVTRDFLGINPAALPREALSVLKALRRDNEFTLTRLRGLLKVANS